MTRGARPATATAALAAALAAAVACAGCAAGGRDAAGGQTLVVISPHDEMIRFELGEGFRRYAREKWGIDASVKWQPARGTGNIMRLLENERKAAAGGRQVGVDVLAGGGTPAHEKAAALGITQPASVPGELLREIPETLGGVRLRAGSGHWHGVTLSSFGIIFNKRSLAARGIREPSSWRDLADPAYDGLVVLADPFESGSARACYEMIWQKEGWREGWSVLARIMANAGAFTHSASDIAKEISSGQAAAGMVIDTYAYVQLEQDGGGLVGFVLPPGETTFTPDPVSVIAGTPRRALAEKFVEFLLGPEGQRLWVVPAGAPGGPLRHNLWHFPVLPAAYAACAGGCKPAGNPFASPIAFRYDEKKGSARARLLTLLVTTGGIQNKKALDAAWAAVRRAGAGQAAALARMTALPFGEAEGMKLADALASPLEAELVEEKLHQFFKKNYRAAAEGAP